MATREENLKKLNTALEAMSEDELEQVAGGFNHEGAQDSEFLADMGLPCERVGAWRISIPLFGDLPGGGGSPNRYFKILHRWKTSQPRRCNEVCCEQTRQDRRRDQIRLKNRLNKLKRGVRHNQQKNPFGRLSEGFFVV